MLTLVFLKDGFFKLSPRALSLFNYIVYRGSLSVNLPPTLGGVAEWIGVHRTTISGELRELIDNGCLEKVNVHVDEDVVELRLLVNGSELEHLEFTHAHADTLDSLVTNMYSAMSISSRGQRLSPVNTLLLMLLLAYADQEGYIDKLSQTVMRKRLGFTDAQLKSQMKKLRSMGLLHVLISGGAYQGISGRVNSKLKIELDALNQLLSSPEHQVATYSSRDEFISLDCLSAIPHLFEAELPESNSTVAPEYIYPPLKPLTIYEEVIPLLLPSSQRPRYRFYHHLTALCLTYAVKGMEQLNSQIDELYAQALDEWFDSIKTNEQLKAFDDHIRASLNSDLKVERLSDRVAKKLAQEARLNDESSLSEIDGEEAENVTLEEYQEEQLMNAKLQQEAFIEMLSEFTWVLMLELYSPLKKRGYFTPATRLQVTLHRISLGTLKVQIDSQSPSE